MPKFDLWINLMLHFPNFPNTLNFFQIIFVCEQSDFFNRMKKNEVNSPRFIIELFIHIFSNLLGSPLGSLNISLFLQSFLREAAGHVAQCDATLTRALMVIRFPLYVREVSRRLQALRWFLRPLLRLSSVFTLPRNVSFSFAPLLTQF